MGTGELAALTAAALWACSSLIYGRTPLSAWQINFGKNIVASILLLIHLAVVVWLVDRPMFSADLRTFTALAISSVVGIVIGDTFFFRSLQILGPRRALIVSTTSPLFATIAGWVVLGETLSWVSFAGILLTLTGVAIVISERGVSEEATGHFPATAFRGIVLGLIGSIMNAGGATFSRLGTSGDEALSIGGCDPLEAAVIRVSVAAAAAVLAALCVGQLMATARKSFDPMTLKCYLPAVVCGPWLGIWMSQIAYKNSQLAVAITLTCTTPIFVLPLMRYFYGSRISIRGLVGTMIALAGVYLTVSA